jgi:hypothetical protein
MQKIRRGRPLQRPFEAWSLHRNLKVPRQLRNDGSWGSHQVLIADEKRLATHEVPKRYEMHQAPLEDGPLKSVRPIDGA